MTSVMRWTFVASFLAGVAINTAIFLRAGLSSPSPAAPLIVSPTHDSSDEPSHQADANDGRKDDARIATAHNTGKTASIPNIYLPASIGSAGTGRFEAVSDGSDLASGGESKSDSAASAGGDYSALGPGVGIPGGGAAVASPSATVGSFGFIAGIAIPAPSTPANPVSPAIAGAATPVIAPAIAAVPPTVVPLPATSKPVPASVPSQASAAATPAAIAAAPTGPISVPSPGPAPNAAAPAPPPVSTAPASDGPALPSDPSKYLQNGGTTIIDDVLRADAVDILGGRLGGHGVVETTLLTIGPGATLAPGNSPGVFTTDSELLLQGILEIEIAGTDNSDPAHPQYDVLVVNGKARFAPHSSVLFVFYPIYTPISGDEWEFLTADSLEGLDNLTFSTVGLSEAFGYQVYAEEDDLYLRIYSIAQGPEAPEADEDILYSGVAVPEPPTAILVLLGLVLLRWRPLKRSDPSRNGR